VREQVRRHPNELVLATTAEEVRAAKKHGKIAALMGVEGGHMIGAISASCAAMPHLACDI